MKPIGASADHHEKAGGAPPREMWRGDSDNLLFRYTNALYRAQGLSEIYEAALDTICEGLGCARASILRFDAGGVMRFTAWRGLSTAYRAAVEGHSPWQSDERDAQPICIEDIMLSPESDAIKATVSREGICGLAFIPLTVNGSLTGKFMVYYDVPRLFTDRERELALTIARQLGFAIERENGEATARRLAAIVDSSEDPIISKALDGTITSWNRAAERLFGYTAAEILGRNVMLLFPSDRIEEEARILARIGAGERVESFETVRLHKDGTGIDVSLTVSPLKDRQGNVIGASKIARDVTERRRGADRQALLLREMDHRVKNLFALAASLVQLSARGAETPADLARSVVERLTTLSRAHSLTMSGGAGTSGCDHALHALVNVILEPFGASGENQRIAISGADAELPDELITPLALLLYELATNAVKHGGLSTAGGRVIVNTHVGPAGLILSWKEIGGPSVAEAGSADGFGSKLMAATARQLGSATHHWERDGLRVEILVSAR
jgi:PAS domain S-box-containing protein